MQGLLGNPVIQGLLGGGGPMGVRAQSQQQLAQMLPRSAGGMMGAPSAPQRDNGYAQAISGIGGSIADAISERVAKSEANDAAKARVTSMLGMGGEGRNAAMAAGGGQTNAAAQMQNVAPGERLAQIGVPERARLLVLGAIVAGDWPTADKVLTSFALQKPDAFTLSPGETRFEGGRAVASVEEPVDYNSMIISGPDGQPMLNPLFMQGKERLAAAGANRTTNNVNLPPMPGEFAKEAGKGLWSEFKETQDAGKNAQTTLGRINNAQALLNRIETGALKPTTTALKSYAKWFGVDLEGLGIRDDVADAEAFRAITGEFLMDYIQQTKGAISEAENRLFASFSPGLAQTKEANQFLLDVARRKAQRDRDLATFSIEYFSTNDPTDLGWYEARDEWLRSNPLVTAEEVDRFQGMAGSAQRDTLGNTSVETPGMNRDGQMGRSNNGWSIRRKD